MYTKIINPKTSKLVNINSKIGKRIINKYITGQNGGADSFDIQEYKQKRRIYDQYARLVSYSAQDPPTPPQRPPAVNEPTPVKPLRPDECGLTRAEEDDVSIWRAHYEAGWNDYTFGDPSESQREMYTRISAIEYQFDADEEVMINKIISAGPAWWRKPGAVHALMIWPGESRKTHFTRTHEIIAMWRSEKTIQDQWVDHRKSDVIRQMSEMK